MAGSFPVFRGFGGIDRRTSRCNGKSHAKAGGFVISYVLERKRCRIGAPLISSCTKPHEYE